MGFLTLCSCMQAICIPFVGIAGDACNRIALIVAGTIIWGSMSVGMGFAANYAEVLPDVYSYSHRPDLCCACLRMSRALGCRLRHGPL